MFTNQKKNRIGDGSRWGKSPVFSSISGSTSPPPEEEGEGGEAVPKVMVVKEMTAEDMKRGGGSAGVRNWRSAGEFFFLSQ